MKRLIMVFIFVLVSFIATCNADDFNIIKQGTYNLTLEQKTISANSCIVEIFDIDSIGNKIPDQIFATVESGEWISNLPSAVTVSFSDNTVDKIIEYWDVSFANVKNGGRVIFTRTIINNDPIERESYNWNILFKCKYIKYKQG